ncbi:MAG: reverse transcriptase domain-containing protein, partial [Gaiellaceae bacterium]
WLGIAHDVGQAMCYWILKSNGQVVARTTVRPLSDDETKDPLEKEKRVEFTKSVTEFIGEFDGELIYNEQPLDEPEQPELLTVHTDDHGEALVTSEEERPPEVQLGSDPLVNAELILPRGDSHEMGTIVGRKRDEDGHLVGRKHLMPNLDSRVYRVRFSDGNEEDFVYNQIAEHITMHVDTEGNQYRLFKAIVDHRIDQDKAVAKADQYRVDSNGRRYMKKTTAGVELQIEWVDKSTSWRTLRDLKETNMVEVAEYARDNGLLDLPAFEWWARSVLKKKERLIKASKSRHIRVGYKFGLPVPVSVEHAYQIDEQNGNTLWRDSLEKELKNVRVALEFRGKDAKPPPGFKQISLHVVFDIKMDFTRKSRLVAGGHLTDPPLVMTYSSVVSRESVRIAMLLASVNACELVMLDIGNAYLNAPTSEKVYAYAGPEFGDQQGSLVVIVRALYGLKSAGASWRSHLAST